MITPSQSLTMAKTLDTSYYENGVKTGLPTTMLKRSTSVRVRKSSRVKRSWIARIYSFSLCRAQKSIDFRYHR